MIHSETYRANNDSLRTAGEADSCFYCGVSLGCEHKDGCVLRRRTIVVRFSVDIVQSVPAHWDKNQIEFYYNDGTWCADNLRAMLDSIKDKDENCLCPYTQAEFVREATPDDELPWNIEA